MNPSENINSFLSGLNLSKLPLEQIIYTLLTLLIGIIAIRIVCKILRRLLDRPAIDPRAQRYAVSGIRAVLWVVLILILADQLGIPVTSLVALFSVVSLAVSLAIQNVLSNIAGGLVILITKPFQLGDYIDTPSGRGSVQNISLHCTHLQTDDGQRLIVPNSILSAEKITNFTTTGSRRINLTVTASYDAPIATVRQACLDAIAATDNILDDPAPLVLVNAYNASSIEYMLRVWCKPDQYNDVYFPLMERLHASFAEAGVEMTYNHLNVHIMSE